MSVSIFIQVAACSRQGSKNTGGQIWRPNLSRITAWPLLVAVPSSDLPPCDPVVTRGGRSACRPDGCGCSTARSSSWPPWCGWWWMCLCSCTLRTAPLALLVAKALQMVVLLSLTGHTKRKARDSWKKSSLKVGHVSLSLFVCLSPFLPLPVSLFVCLSLFPLRLSLSLCLPFTLPPSPRLSLFVCLSLLLVSLFVCHSLLPLPVSLFAFHSSLSLSLSVFAFHSSLSPSLSLCLSLRPLPVSHCLPLTPSSHCLSLFVYLSLLPLPISLFAFHSSLSLSLSLFVCLSLLPLPVSLSLCLPFTSPSSCLSTFTPLSPRLSPFVYLSLLLSLSLSLILVSLIPVLMIVTFSFHVLSDTAGFTL